MKPPCARALNGARPPRMRQTGYTEKGRTSHLPKCNRAGLAGPALCEDCGGLKLAFQLGQLIAFLWPAGQIQLKLHNPVYTELGRAVGVRRMVRS
jgi:hypothetical protein